MGAKDYAGIRLTRRVRQLGSDPLRRAHAHLVLEDFDTVRPNGCNPRRKRGQHWADPPTSTPQTESTYKELGRDDLLTRMNVMTGNWERIRSSAIVESLSDNSLQPSITDTAARWRMLRELAKVRVHAQHGSSAVKGRR